MEAADPQLMARTTAVAPPDLAPGTPVVVRCKFDGHWSHEFEVSRREADGYRVRQISDHLELPATFAVDDVRPVV